MRNNYQITIKTHLSKSLVLQLGDFSFYRLPTGDTILIATLLDLAGFYGLFNRCRDLGLTIIAVTPLPNNSVEPRRSKHTNLQATL